VQASDFAAIYAQVIRHTPMVPAPSLGPGVCLKLESLQRTGSFKLRGALLRVAALGPAARAAGVVTASAGNHGQGVALAGQRLGIRTCVVVPQSAPAVKRSAILALGAEVIEWPGGYDDAEAEGKRLASARGAVFVSAFDDDLVMHGNGGLLAEEILADRADVKQIVVPVGGGGMIAGMARSLAGRGVAVIGAQPAANCAMAESLRDGRAYTTYHGLKTLAEGCEGAVAERTFEVCRAHAVPMVLVDEPAIRAAVAAMYRIGIVVEPSAAVAVAALRTGVVQPVAAGATVVVVSGQNIDPELLDEILREHGVIGPGAVAGAAFTGA
jgi:threonine dehydratase